MLALNQGYKKGLKYYFEKTKPDTDGIVYKSSQFTECIALSSST